MAVAYAKERDVVATKQINNKTASRERRDRAILID
jgi:hypothetical protein